MIFVTTGTTNHPFLRMDTLVQEIGDHFHEEIIYQNEVTSLVPSKKLKIMHQITFDDFIHTIRRARLVITHGGPATVYQVLREGKIPYVLPRHVTYHEHVDDHQVYFANHLAKKQQVVVLCKPAVVEITEDKKVKPWHAETLPLLVGRLREYVESHA